MNKTISVRTVEATEAKAEKVYVRFTLSQRIEHFVLLVSFSLLGITGLAQKYATTSGGEAVLSLLGGIEMSRLIHRASAVVLMAVSIYHIVAVLYRVIVLRSPLNMLPTPLDFKHLFQDVMYYLGRRAHKANYGRYNYAEKAEYLAVVWGTLIMAITGFMMWNPIGTTRFLPGEFIPAAKAAHSGEALLAVLAIILWHFYHVHIRHFNKSMFTGKMTEEEMKEEHPGELAILKTGKVAQRPAPQVLRRRQRIFFPIAAVMTLALSVGLYEFVTLEQTALATIPRGENVPIFVPITPTPLPTPLPTLTPTPGGELALGSWEEGIAGLLENRCGNCHGQNAFGNLSLETYAQALAGGSSGASIVPGDPFNSVLVQVQQAGGHPGQLAPEELEAIIAWIEAGAVEK